MTITQQPPQPQAPTDPADCFSQVPTQADVGKPGSGMSWDQALQNIAPQGGMTNEHLATSEVILQSDEQRKPD